MNSTYYIIIPPTPNHYIVPNVARKSKKKEKGQQDFPEQRGRGLRIAME